MSLCRIILSQYLTPGEEGAIAQQGGHVKMSFHPEFLTAAPKRQQISNTRPPLHYLGLVC